MVSNDKCVENCIGNKVVEYLKVLAVVGAMLGVKCVDIGRKSINIPWELLYTHKELTGEDFVEHPKIVARNRFE